jgi:hypothetical protein
MSLIPRFVTVVSALAILVQFGCFPVTTRPSVTSVDLSVAALPASGRPSVPVVVDAEVTNAGSTRVWHCQGCGCGDGVALTVLGPDSVEVRIQDPGHPSPLCPDAFGSFDPGGSLAEHLVFTGTLYSARRPTLPTQTYAAPPGTYTVIARFRYKTDMFGQWTSLERRTAFVWAP